MENMHFTGLGTVFLGNDEISIKDFLTNMEQKLGTNSYNINHNENGNLVIRYNDRDYKVSLSDDEINNPSKYPYLNRLFQLARIETKIDSTKYDKESLNAELCLKDKKKLLRILRKKKNSISFDNLCNYLVGLLENLGDTVDEFYFNDIFDLNRFISLTFGIVALIFAVPAVLVFEVSPIWLLTALSGVAISIVIDAGYFLINYIPRRFVTFIDFLADFKPDEEKKVCKIKIKELKKSILKDIIAKLKIKNNKDIVDMKMVSNDNGVETYAPIQEVEAEKTKLDNMISKLLYCSIQSLNEVDILYRDNLKQKLDNLLKKYQDLVTAKKSDAEIMNEITREWNDIDMEIAEARNTDATRYYEAQSLIDVLDNIDTYPVEETIQEPSSLDEGPKKREIKPFKNTSNN